MPIYKGFDFPIGKVTVELPSNFEHRNETICFRFLKSQFNSFIKIRLQGIKDRNWEASNIGGCNKYLGRRYGNLDQGGNGANGEK